MADISEGVDIMKKKEKPVQLEECMKDEQEFDDSEDEISEEEDIMDGNKGKTEELANDERACDTEVDKNTNKNTGGMEVENGEEIKTLSGRDPKKQEMDEGLELALVEEAAKEKLWKKIKTQRRKKRRRII